VAPNIPPCISTLNEKSTMWWTKSPLDWKSCLPKIDELGPLDSLFCPFDDARPTLKPQAVLHKHSLKVRLTGRLSRLTCLVNWIGKYVRFPPGIYQE
jgi:hypothetical protein